MIIGGLAGHPLNRPSGTFSPTGEKAGMRGPTDDSTTSDWELVLLRAPHPAMFQHLGRAWMRGRRRVCHTTALPFQSGLESV